MALDTVLQFPLCFTTQDNRCHCLPATLTCLRAKRCCSCCCKFHWLCWISSSMEGVPWGVGMGAVGGKDGWANAWICGLVSMSWLCLHNTAKKHMRTYSEKVAHKHKYIHRSTPSSYWNPSSTLPNQLLQMITNWKCWFSAWLLGFCQGQGHHLSDSDPLFAKWKYHQKLLQRNWNIRWNTLLHKPISFTQWEHTHTRLTLLLLQGQLVLVVAIKVPAKEEWELGILLLLFHCHLFELRAITRHKLG